MYLFFDCETGGLHPQYSLLTLAAVAVDKHFEPLFNGAAASSLYLQIRHPAYLVTPEALTINKIDLVHHSAIGTPLGDAQEKFERWLSNVCAHVGGKLIPAGHNVSFDLKFVWEQLLPSDQWHKYCDYHTYDTMTMAAGLRAAGKIEAGRRLKLGALCEYFAIPLEDAHNAMADTRATIELARAFADMLNPELSAQGLPEVAADRGGQAPQP